MLESTLPIRSFCWRDGVFRSSFDQGDRPEGWAGQFSVASADADGRIMLARDRLGINKLFFAVHEVGRVLAGNYLIDLVSRGVPIEAVYSVPAGHVVEVDLDRRRVSATFCAAMEPGPAQAEASTDVIAREIREHLEGWFRRLAGQFEDRRIWVCLSGGLDSGLIAALARAHFRDVTAYTYVFADRGTPASEDATSAGRLADALGIPLRLVPASSDDVRAVLDDAVCYGQDWRDFNVHCAVVNALLARAMRRDAAASAGDPAPLVLTGDLANEFLADYAPVSYNGEEYYRLPRLSPPLLRLALIRGLDAGDREVGVFNRCGLDVIQPYGLVVDHYLRLPGGFIGEPQAKQQLGRAMAGDLLPPFVFDRAKVRAQLGSAADAPGILSVLAADGCGAAGLRDVFCRVFNVRSPGFLNTFIRAGRYRSMTRFPSEASWIDGYLAA